jgi:hypothetical protein
VAVAVAVLAGLIASVGTVEEAVAQVPNSCQERGVRAESYAYGVHSGYTGLQVAPTVRDATCLAVGFQEGSRLRARLGTNPDCGSSYQDGYQQAFAGEDMVIRGPSTCLKYGYDFGIAWLRSNARDQRADIVGASCAAAYRNGFERGQRMSVPDPPMDRRDAFCYLSGHTWATRGQ